MLGISFCTSSGGRKQEQSCSAKKRWQEIRQLASKSSAFSMAHSSMVITEGLGLGTSPEVSYETCSKVNHPKRYAESISQPESPTSPQPQPSTILVFECQGSFQAVSLRGVRLK